MRNKQGFPEGMHGKQVTDPTEEEVTYATIGLLSFIGILVVILLSILFIR